jgi:predicted ATP-dependent serine protease
MAKTQKINMGMTPATSLIDAAKAEMDSWGKTDLYSTGDQILDEYLGNSFTGGYGRKDGYEILTIFGDTGMNKSTFATSIILDPASKGTQIAYFALEDDPKDVVRRILIMCDMNEEKARTITNNILFMPESDGYTLDSMAEAIEKIFDVVDIIVIDPLQFIFEASVAEKGETEFNRQRLFMRKMNNLMKHTNKTLIIVSHTGKGGGKDARTGVDRIIGSSAVAQVSTKVIEINRKEDGLQGIRLWKSRFTPYRFCGVQIRLDNMVVRTVYELSDLPQARKAWAGQM